MSLPSASDVALASTAIGAVYFAYRALTKGKSPAHLPPGPKPAVFIGNVLQMPTSKQPETFREWAAVYGAFASPWFA